MAALAVVRLVGVWARGGTPVMGLGVGMQANISSHPQNEGHEGMWAVAYSCSICLGHN